MEEMILSLELSEMVVQGTEQLCGAGFGALFGAAGWDLCECPWLGPAVELAVLGGSG